jgi:signal transduction histidine kinase
MIRHMVAGGRLDRLVTALLWTALATQAASAVLLAIEWADLAPADAYPGVLSTLGGVVYATLGALIVRRVRNRVGWILLGEGLLGGVLSLMGGYVVFGLLTDPGSLPGARVVGVLSEVAFVPVAFGLGYLLLLFPTGSLPSKRWRVVPALTVAATAVAMVGFVVTPRQVAIPAPGGVSLTFPNPIAIRSLGGFASAALIGTLPALGVAVAALFAVAFAALVIRFRSGGPELRRQIAWVAAVAIAAVASNAVLAVAQLSCRCTDSVWMVALSWTAAAVAVLGIPIAITVAILKHGLYRIDVIINRAVVYGLLATALTAVYVGIVVGIGTLAGRHGGTFLTIAAAVAVALLFQPLRERARRVANRLVYGDRATPYQVLSDFAERVGGTYALDDVLQRTAMILAQGTSAGRVDVWLRVGQELRPAASWPPGLDGLRPIPLPAGGDLPPLDGVTRAVAVRHDDELLGALSVEKPRAEAVTPTEDKLIEDLASQAGLVLRNVRLATELQSTIDELRASRRRLVEAQDEERRKIERNLHDGAQQRLVALGAQLGLLDRVADEPERVRRATSGLRDAVREALDDLRDLARGIYPPLLADKGLPAALEAQGRRAVVPTRVETDGIGRYPRDVEAAVYFCALEAMQNVAKYAGASTTTVRVREEDGALVFEIQDDGSGFDPSSTSHGSGLQGMIDRLDAIGGRLDVESEPGRGALVRGRIPLS